jgi:hypothetical protein
MKRLFMALILIVLFGLNHKINKVAVAALGLDLHDSLSGNPMDPIEYWRKMRPQDFVGAPTIWQVLA